MRNRTRYRKRIAVPDGVRALLDYVSRGDIVGWNKLVLEKPPVGLDDLRLHGVCLQGICLAGVSLNGAEFIGCDLQNADFTGAELADANFVKSHLSAAKFVGCKAMRARFDHGRLPSASFVRANLQEASFIAALAPKSDFTEADLEEANFQAADLRTAVFQRANLRGADLRLAELDAAVFVDANLESSKLSGAGLPTATLDAVKSASVPEQAVIVQFKYGSTDLSPLFALEDELIAAIEAARAGDLDGNEVATDGSDGSLYMYGPDADKLFEVVRPVLESATCIRNAVAKIRYGPPEKGVKERKVAIGA